MLNKCGTRLWIVDNVWRQSREISNSIDDAHYSAWFFTHHIDIILSLWSMWISRIKHRSLHNKLHRVRCINGRKRKSNTQIKERLLGQKFVAVFNRSRSNQNERALIFQRVLRFCASFLINTWRNAENELNCKSGVWSWTDSITGALHRGGAKFNWKNAAQSAWTNRILVGHERARIRAHDAEQKRTQKRAQKLAQKRSQKSTQVPVRKR